MVKIPWHFFKIPWQFPDLEKILFFPDFSLTRGNPVEEKINVRKPISYWATVFMTSRMGCVIPNEKVHVGWQQSHRQKWVTRISGYQWKSSQETGFPLFSSDKIPWLFPDFSIISFIFPWFLYIEYMAFSQYLFFYEWPLLTVGHKSTCTKILFLQYPEVSTFTLLSLKNTLMKLK